MLVNLPLLLEMLYFAATRSTSGVGSTPGKSTEEDRRVVVGLVEGLEDVEGLLLDVALAHHLADEVGQRRGNAVGADRAQQQQAVELADLLEGLGHVRGLRVGLVVPLLPLQHVGLQRLAERREGRDALQGAAGRPDVVVQEGLERVGHGGRVEVHLSDDQVAHLLRQQLARAQQDSQGEHGAHDQLVLLEEAAARVLEGRVGDGLDQFAHPAGQRARGKRFLLLASLEFGLGGRLFCGVLTFLLFLLGDVDGLGGLALCGFTLLDLLFQALFLSGVCALHGLLGQGLGLLNHGLLLGDFGGTAVLLGDHRVGLELLVRGNGVDGAVDCHDKALQRVLVETVDLGQVGQQEVDQRTAGCGGAVVLGGLVDLGLGGLGDFHLLRNFHRYLFGVLQVLDKFDVVQDVSLGVRETREEFVLQILELDLEVVLLLDEFHLLLGQIRALAADDQREQLVAEAVLRDHEVDQGGLGLDFRGVVGVAQLRVQEQPEVVVQGQVLAGELQDSVAAALDELPGDDWHEHGVHALVHVLDQGGVAVFDGHLQVPVHVLRADAQLLQVVVALLFAHPGDALQLGVDHEGVALGVGEDGSVFD